MGDWIHIVKWHRGTDADLEAFLDEECKGGWELFKINRYWDSTPNAYWCVFRRQSE